MDVNDRGALREELRAQRTRLTPAQRIAAATGVAATLEQLPEFIVDQRVAGYWAVAGELPLHVAVGALTSRDQRYYLPVLERQRRLRFAPWRVGAEVHANRYGIPEPQCDAGDLLGLYPYGAEPMRLYAAPLEPTRGSSNPLARLDFFDTGGTLVARDAAQRNR